MKPPPVICNHPLDEKFLMRFRRTSHRFVGRRSSSARLCSQPSPCPAVPGRPLPEEPAGKEKPLLWRTCDARPMMPSPSGFPSRQSVWSISTIPTRIRQDHIHRLHTNRISAVSPRQRTAGVLTTLGRYLQNLLLRPRNLSRRQIIAEKEGSAPGQITSFTDMATRSIPIVSWPVDPLGYFNLVPHAHTGRPFDIPGIGKFEAAVVQEEEFYERQMDPASVELVCHGQKRPTVFTRLAKVSWEIDEEGNKVFDGSWRAGELDGNGVAEPGFADARNLHLGREIYLRRKWKARLLVVREHRSRHNNDRSSRANSKIV